MKISQSTQKSIFSRKRFLSHLLGGALILGTSACNNLLPRPQKMLKPKAPNISHDKGPYRLHQIPPSSKKLTQSQFLIINQPSNEPDMSLALDPFETSLVYERLLTVDPLTSNLFEGAAIKLEWIEPNMVNFLVKPNNFFHSSDSNTQKLLPVSSEMITEDFNIKSSSKSFFWNTIISSIHDIPDVRSPNGTVQLKLNGTYSYLLDDLSSASGEIRSPYRYQGLSERSGSGPFKPILLNSDSRHLVRNPRSAPLGHSLLEQITFRKLNSSQWMHQSSSDTPTIWLNQEPSKTESYLIKDTRPADSLWILGMRIPTANTDTVTPGNAFLKDSRMRKAITHAIDGNSIAKYVGGLPATLITGPYSADILTANQIASTGSLAFNGNLTRDYLDAIGYNGEPLRLLHLNLEPYLTVMSILKSQLQAVGFIIEPVPISPQRLGDALTTTSFDIALLKIGPQHSPNQALQIYRTSNQERDSDNPWGFSSPVFDKILEDAADTMLPSERAELHVKAQKALLDLAPAVVPLATTSSSIWRDSRVGGYHHNAYDYNQTSLSRNWYIGD
jgi:ABC-type transport system substrate-binding protein